MPSVSQSQVDDADESRGVRRLARLLSQVDRLPIALFWYLVIGGLMSFWRLGATGLMAMEGMVVDGARSMLESGNWTVPRVYGEIYTYKPALAYWLLAVPLRVSDMPPEWAIRLPFALCGFFLGLMILLVVRRLSGTRIGLYAALAMACGVLYQQKVRLAEFDLALLAGVGVAVVAACYNLAAERPRVELWIVGYLGLTAGFLAKGGPALMVYAPGLLAAAWAGGRLRSLFRWQHLVAAALALGLVTGYLWAAWASDGAAAFEQPLLEAKARGLGWLLGDAGEAAAELNAFRQAEGEAELSSGIVGALGRMAIKPLVIWQISMPWSLVLPAVFALRRRKIRDDATARLVGVAGSFLIAGAVAFMLVSTHESRYYLPLSVPLAILCGVVVGDAYEMSAGWRRGLRIAVVALATLLGVLTPIAALVIDASTISPAERAAMAAAGIATLVATAFWSRRSRHQSLAPLLTVSSLCFLVVWSCGLEQRRASSRVLESQAEAIGRFLPPGVTVWTPGPADVAGKNASLFFYLDHPVRAFRPELDLPPPGSYCVVPSDRFGDLDDPPGFVFDEVYRAEQRDRDFAVGHCTWQRSLPG